MSIWHAVEPHPLMYTQIVKDCIPKEIRQFLMDGDDTPLHKHRSLILNLACGPTVLVDQSRKTLLTGYV